MRTARSELGDIIFRYRSMIPSSLIHEWPATPADAVAIQNQLRGSVVIAPPEKPIETIAGADISFDKYSPTLFAGIVLLRVDTLEILEEVGVEAAARFPYIPGFLSFRESPPLLEAWKRLTTKPDAIMLDGQGIAHPRRLGIASHIGLLLGLPSFGCAKSVLVGKYQEPPIERGEWTPMIDRGETVGAALRTKRNVTPIYVSPGHLIDLPTSIDLTLRTTGKYRQPEPTRRAHLLVNAMRRGERSFG